MLDRDGAPLANALVEIWQCDANGRYHHVGDRSSERPLDEHFQGFGAIRTDTEGRYRFRTIKPVPYPGRTPRIHARVVPPDGRELVTQINLEDHPLWAVVDGRGRVLAATDSRQAPVGVLLSELTGDAQPLEGLTVHAGDARVRMLAPLIYQGRSMGQMLTELDASDLAAERRQAVLYLLLGNALATGLIALGGYLAMRRMLHPIATFTSHMGDGAGKPKPIPGE